MECFHHGPGSRDQALTETGICRGGRQLVFREAQWLKDELVRIGYKRYIPSEANYIFFKGPEGFLISVCESES